MNLSCIFNQFHFLAPLNSPANSKNWTPYTSVMHFVVSILYTHPLSQCYA